MKSRDEIVIIMLQWMRLYTLGSTGSRELKTFLKIRLISSRIDEKLKNKEGKYMLLKGKFGPILRPFDAIVEAVLLGRGGDSLGQCRGSRICGQFASIFASKRPRFLPRSGHDRATIGSRSGHDRGLIVTLGLRRLPSDPVEAIPRRKLPDRGSIAPRSRFDRTAIVEFFHESFRPSDGASGDWTVRSRSSSICC